MLKIRLVFKQMQLLVKLQSFQMSFLLINKRRLSSRVISAWTDLSRPSEWLVHWTQRLRQHLLMKIFLLALDSRVPRTSHFKPCLPSPPPSAPSVPSPRSNARPYFVPSCQGGETLDHAPFSFHVTHCAKYIVGS